MTDQTNNQAENMNNDNTATETASKAKGFFRRNGKKMAVGVTVGAVLGGAGLYLKNRWSDSGVGEGVGDAVESAVSHFMK